MGADFGPWLSPWEESKVCNFEGLDSIKGVYKTSISQRKSIYLSLGKPSTTIEITAKRPKDEPISKYKADIYNLDIKTKVHSIDKSLKSKRVDSSV